MSWRRAEAHEHDAIVHMGLALYEEDPSPEPIGREQFENTLRTFAEQPLRGCALVLELEGRLAGYALLASFWSNELGGELCTIDELWVEPKSRSRGWATGLVKDLAEGRGPWPGHAVALELEVTPSNARARALYERLGFAAKNTTLRRRTQLNAKR